MTIEHPGSRRLTPVAKVVSPLTRLKMAKLQGATFKVAPYQVADLKFEISKLWHNSVRRGAPMNLTVNGTARSFDGDPDMPLLWYLRDDLRLTGTRFGCGAGLCGACTVHVEGQAVRACQTAMRTLQNKQVVTIDGLSPNGNHPVPRAW